MQNGRKRGKKEKVTETCGRITKEKTIADEVRKGRRGRGQYIPFLFILADQKCQLKGGKTWA